ncbi:MAG: fluoride efflux transporter CrcB [Gammaproteobacteria bacterium]|nr:fluoride efflux transporter CrcB [Gammaproteobacteria bacterium]
MTSYFFIAAGGALGALSRYWLGSAVQGLTGSNFPLGTFMVNVLGSFLIGLLFIALSERILLAETLRPLIVIGFLGAMTTFSTFSLDALLLLQNGHYNSAFLYVLGSVAICLLAASAGLFLARAIF